MDQAENEGYLNSLNDLKPTAPFDFGDKEAIMVRVTRG